MNETEYIRLLDKVVRESRKYGRILIIINRNSPGFEENPIGKILENMEHNVRINLDKPEDGQN